MHGGQKTRSAPLASKMLRELLTMVMAPGVDPGFKIEILKELRARGLDPGKVAWPVIDATDAGNSGSEPSATRIQTPAEIRRKPGPISPETEGTQPPGGQEPCVDSRSEPGVSLPDRAAEAWKHDPSNQPVRPEHPWWRRRLDLFLAIAGGMAIAVFSPESLRKANVAAPLLLAIAVSLGREILTRHLQARSSLSQAAKRTSHFILAILLLAVGFNSLYNTLAYRPSPEKWPSSFSLTGEPPPIGDNPPIQSSESINNIMMTYVFTTGQDVLFNMIRQRFPDLAREVELKERRFHRRFSPSVTRIEEMLLGGDPSRQDLAAARERIKMTIESQITTRASALSTLEEMEERIDGTADDSIIETLLLYNPVYERNPVKEYLDGFAARFVSTGLGKAQGLRLSLKYPLSWQDSEGERPHIARKFQSQRRRLVMAILTVHDLPDGFSDVEYSSLSPDEKREVLDVSFFGENLDQEMPMKEVVVHDEGLCELAGQPAKWIEFSGSRHIHTDVWSADRGVVFYLVFDVQVVSLQFFASDSGSTTDPPDPVAVFDGYGPLFMQMAISFDILNRYGN